MRVPVCVCVYTLRIVSRDKILRFKKKALIINYLSAGEFFVGYYNNLAFWSSFLHFLPLFRCTHATSVFHSFCSCFVLITNSELSKKASM